MDYVVVTKDLTVVFEKSSDTKAIVKVIEINDQIVKKFEDLNMSLSSESDKILLGKGVEDAIENGRYEAGTKIEKGEKELQGDKREEHIIRTCITLPVFKDFDIEVVAEMKMDIDLGRLILTSVTRG